MHNVSSIQLLCRAVGIQIFIIDKFLKEILLYHQVVVLWISGIN